MRAARAAACWCWGVREETRAYDLLHCSAGVRSLLLGSCRCRAAGIHPHHAHTRSIPRLPPPAGACGHPAGRGEQAGAGGTRARGRRVGGPYFPEKPPAPPPARPHPGRPEREGRMQQQQRDPPGQAARGSRICISYVMHRKFPLSEPDRSEAHDAGCRQPWGRGPSGGVGPATGDGLVGGTAPRCPSGQRPKESDPFLTAPLWPEVPGGSAKMGGGLTSESRGKWVGAEGGTRCKPSTKCGTGPAGSSTHEAGPPPSRWPRGWALGTVGGMLRLPLRYKSFILRNSPRN